MCQSMIIFFFKQKTAYEMRIGDWSSDVCSSDLGDDRAEQRRLADPRGSGDADHPAAWRRIGGVEQADGLCGVRRGFQHGQGFRHGGLATVGEVLEGDGAPEAHEVQVGRVAAGGSSPKMPGIMPELPSAAPFSRPGRPVPRRCTLPRKRPERLWLSFAAPWHQNTNPETPAP